MRNKLAQLFAALPMWFASMAAFADYKLNLQTPNTALGHTIFDLHTVITWICVVIFVVVFGFMFYAIYAHRKSVGHKAANFHEHFWVEVGWTVIPCFILIAMAVPATKALKELRDTSDPDITLKVTGYQWKWGYDYIKGEGEGISYYASLSTPQAQINGTEKKGENYLLETDVNVILPAGKKVRVLVTAADVIHAWWVPALTIKQDAVPGFIRDTWFKAEKPGIYRGQCAELCGKDHGFMPIVVEIKSQEDYTKWVASQQANIKKKEAQNAPDKVWTADELKAHGDKLYGNTCAACHMPTGKGNPPTFPALDGSKLAAGPKEGAIERVLNGKPGTAMASFKHMSDADLAGILTYVRSSWGNKAGAVTPQEVKAVRDGKPLSAAEAAPAAPAAEKAADKPAEKAAEKKDDKAAASALPAVVHFDTASAKLNAQEQKTVAAVAGQIKGGGKVEVTGYTDKAGDQKANLELAKQRAVGVRDALIAAGIAKDSIIMKPPAAVESGGDPKNARRVEMNAAK